MSSLRNIYMAVIDDGESTCRSTGRLLRAARLHPITYSSAAAIRHVIGPENPERKEVPWPADCIHGSVTQTSSKENL
jgi:hypothetical protein